MYHDVNIKWHTINNDKYNNIIKTNYNDEISKYNDMVPMTNISATYNHDNNIITILTRD